MYKDPSVTLAGPNSGRMVTLGSFGVSIVYEFEEPIQNSDQNPYGIDFIVYGNVQKSETGESYSSGMEPAAVMVSQDWYKSCLYYAVWYVHSNHFLPAHTTYFHQICKNLYCTEQR